MRCVVYDDTLSNERQYYQKTIKDLISDDPAIVYTLDINKAFVFTDKSRARAFIKQYGGKIKILNKQTNALIVIDDFL